MDASLYEEILERKALALLDRGTPACRSIDTACDEILSSAQYGGAAYRFTLRMALTAASRSLRKRHFADPVPPSFHTTP